MGCKPSLNSLTILISEPNRDYRKITWLRFFQIGRTQGNQIK